MFKSLSLTNLIQRDHLTLSFFAFYTFDVLVERATFESIYEHLIKIGLGSFAQEKVAYMAVELYTRKNKPTSLWSPLVLMWRHQSRTTGNIQSSPIQSTRPYLPLPAPA